MAAGIAGEIMQKADSLRQFPLRGRTIGDDAAYRQVVLNVSYAPYALQYRVDADRVVILCVFHGREDRNGD